MSGDGVVRLRELFLAARALAPSEREDWLTTNCPDDALRAEVRSLLAAQPLADQSLDLGAVLRVDDEAEEDGSAGGLFGRFTLLRRLGKGGMGRVDLAFDPRSQREVAIKRLVAVPGSGAETMARFEREWVAASKLDAAGLCPIYEVGEVNGAPYFVMPVVPGESLAEKLERRGGRAANTAEIAWFVALFEKVAAALDRAHEAGLVHRDVKPANIMVRPDGEPVVLDFGVALDSEHADSRLTRTGQLPGTPSYMAPEQIVGSRVDRRTDVYALGVTLYECVCGSPPFVAESRLELFEQIRMRSLPSPRRRNRAVPRDVAAVLDVATQKDPGHRYLTARAMAEDLERVRRSQPVLARRLPLWLRLRQWSLRNRLAAVAVAVLGVGLLATGSLLWQRAALNVSIRDELVTERQARVAADSVRSAAQARLDDFRGLEVLHRTRLAVIAERGLYPGWPDRLPAMDAWLAGPAARMQGDLDRLAQSLAALQGRAEAALRARGEPVTKSARLQRELAGLDARIAALTAAHEVRGGLRPVPSADLPESAPDDPAELVAVAWPWIDPDRPVRAHGNETRALAYLSRALELFGESPAAEARYAMLWALVATGADRDRAFPPELIGPLAAATAPDHDPLRYRTAAQRADHVRCRTLGELERARARRSEIEEGLERPWLPGASDAERVLERDLRGAHAALQQHVGPDGLVERVRRRRAWAAAIDELTAAHPGARCTWQEAAAAIRTADGTTASSAYAGRGIELVPVRGLVPIGMNPVTGLWEFYHLRSAFDPRSDADPALIAIPEHAADGSIPVSQGLGIVFVLLPGGRSWVGAQSTDPEGRNYDPETPANTELRAVSIEPFFLARHELTQAQWERLALGESPSALRHGTTELGVAITPCHPVDTAPYRESEELLVRHGLRLPGEWEWEYGCRAGTATRWSCGDRESDLEGYANLLAADFGIRPCLPFLDGYPAHAPVGSFRANAFGMFDMHGNVAEYCRAERPMVGSGFRSLGGSWRDLPAKARAFASEQHDGSGFGMYGVRAARGLR